MLLKNFPCKYYIKFLLFYHSNKEKKKFLIFFKEQLKSPAFYPLSPVLFFFDSLMRMATYSLMKQPHNFSITLQAYTIILSGLNFEINLLQYQSPVSRPTYTFLRQTARYLGGPQTPRIFLFNPSGWSSLIGCTDFIITCIIQHVNKVLLCLLDLWNHCQPDAWVKATGAHGPDPTVRNTSIWLALSWV